MRVEMIAIGNELLSGDVLDRNGAWLGNSLRTIGCLLHARQTVRDDPEEIHQALTLAASRADWVVLSGGLGPTEDDLTVASVARHAEVSLVRDDAVLQGLQERFQRRGVPWTPNNARQADIPEGGEVLANPVGSAPGVLLEVDGTRFILLPGVHREFKAMVESHVVARIAAELHGAVASVVLRCWGQTESGSAATLEDLPEIPGAHLQYRATFPDILLTVGGSGGDRAAASARSEELAAEGRARLGGLVYGEGEQTFEERIGALLQERGMTVATAESCTGGLIASMLTSLPGSSAYFIEGVVTYSNPAKIRRLDVSPAPLDLHGAVSEATVREMVAGICQRSGARLGIAVSGIAGPDGGTADKPVGTVHIAAGLDGIVVHRCVHFPGPRHRVQILAARAALDMARRLCENNPDPPG